MNNRLREIRKELGLNQENFCKPLNISRSHLAGIESGLKNLTDRLIKDICNEYNVNSDYLIDGEGEMFTDPLAGFNMEPEIEEFMRLYLSVDDETKDYVKGMMKKTLGMK
jgi:transcriptional regulator with XRE-family HTH domain